jgi:hypothetical protein
MGRYFILNDQKVIEAENYGAWSEWYESHYRAVEQVAETQLGPSTVLTRFLALDMSLSQRSPAKVFETRVKGGWLNDQWERFSTLEEARAGHDAWVARVRGTQDEDQLPPPGGNW